MNISSTTPVAPTGATNVTWQIDGSGNVSAYIPAATTLSAAILADGPRGFWKGDETSGTTLADSSGNGYNLTITNTSGGFALAKSNIVPTLPSTAFPLCGTLNTDYASSATTLGLTMPFAGDATFECVALFRNLSTVTNGGSVGEFFGFATAGETEDTNWQFGALLSGQSGLVGNLEYFHEYSAGLDQRLTSGVKPPMGVPVHLAYVRTAVNKTIDFYLNGAWCDRLSYSSAPTGGTSDRFYCFGTYSAGGGGNLMGYAAFYNKVLTPARIMAHAIASGIVHG